MTGSERENAEVMDATLEHTAAVRSYVDGGMLMVPEAFASVADRRAMEIFQAEAAMGRSFIQCLGQIYMVATQAGIVAARKEATDATN